MITAPGLSAAMGKNAWRYATVNEYATASGLRPEQVLTEIEDDLDAGTLELEIVDSEVFIHTAPGGRGPDRPSPFAPNMWEFLRERASTQTAYVLWRLARQMELYGWVIETQTTRIRSGLGVLDSPAHLGLVIGQRVVPLLVFPTPDSLSMPHGLLSEYASAGAVTVAVTCAAGTLDSIVVAVRSWNLSRKAAGAEGINVLICEEPTFPPVLLTPDDTAVRPVSLTVINSPNSPVPTNPHPGR